MARTSSDSFTMPDEGAPHKCTWMAFIANKTIWSRRQRPAVERELALIAKTIARYEPVSLLVPQSHKASAENLFGASKSAYPILPITCELDDLWLRDTGSTFVRGTNGEKRALDFNFNGWGNKQMHARDAKVASFIAREAGVDAVSSKLVLEGGCFEVDGAGTAIMSKSCIVNDNRNPGATLEEIEAELKRLLGLRKIIWLEGIAGRDITDGHTDFYARFSSPGQVIVARENDRLSYDYAVTRENIKTLERSTDADGNALALTVIDAPTKFSGKYGVSDFAAGYIGYYLCNNAVVMQAFGDRTADREAFKAVKAAHPDREVVQIAIDAIASGGGTIHCATQQEFRL